MEYRASIDALTLEVQGLSAKIRVLSEENTGLLEKIRVLQIEGKNDRESIARLKALTEKLNANIRDRDDLIVKMMDSLFDEYAKSDLTDGQKKSLFTNAQESDYVGKIIATIDGNLASVERTVMMPQDLGVIKEEERKVSAKWNAIKPYVGKIYPDAQAGVRDLSRVDSRLADWKKRIDEATWKSIRQVFAEQNIDIGAFGTAGEFHARLLAYIDGQLKNPSREKYKTFKNKVWDSPIKDQWLPVIPTDELTAQQRAEIDERIALWGKKISTLLWRGVLIGVFVTAILALAAVAIMRKRKPQPAA